MLLTLAQHHAHWATPVLGYAIIAIIVLALWPGKKGRQ